ncbi:Protein of uncharacterised function (DUF3053) [Serratia fonticola]|uniref:Protein of uncharacterized function (DUF3053) n=1 Tax=Serratia fonticola TaxID=47917 RepID=A0A4U9WGF5_SERFO|nr:Protein of uncharacterised function (DUF3053) [Serratia fonticola]
MRSGVHIPTLSEDQKQKFVLYTGDYAILVGFSQQLTKSVDASLTRRWSRLIRSAPHRTT